MLKNKKGITLVALIVTIIILLILAGVTIAQLTENGLFEKARKAGKESENAQAKEEYEQLAGKVTELETTIENNNKELTSIKGKYEEVKKEIQESKQTTNYDLSQILTLDSNVSSVDGTIKRSGNVIDIKLVNIEKK